MRGVPFVRAVSFVRKKPPPRAGGHAPRGGEEAHRGRELGGGEVQRFRRQRLGGVDVRLGEPLGPDQVAVLRERVQRVYAVHVRLAPRRKTRVSGDLGKQGLRFGERGERRAASAPRERRKGFGVGGAPGVGGGRRRLVQARHAPPYGAQHAEQQAERGVPDQP